MKIFLLNPPSEKGFIRTGRWLRRSRGNQSWAPIWLAYATSFLEGKGEECFLLDASILNLSYSQTEDKIISFNPDFIVYYWGYDSFESDLYFANKLGEERKVILVGPWSYCMPDALLKAPNCYAMTYGEFEYTLLDLINNINVSSVKGIYWRDHINDTIIQNKPRPLCSCEELDNIPFVSSVYKRFLPIKLYHQTSLRFPFTDVFGSRGCPHKCQFCVWTRAFQNGPSYRPRSIKNIISELWYIKHDLPEIKQVWFQDDTLPPKRALELSQAILDENLKICWGCLTRAEQSYETLKLMKESGCRTLHIGYEIPIQQHLDIIQKDITIEQMSEFASNVKKLNMWSSATFMIFPWESKEDIEFTIKWCKKIKPKRMNFIQAQGYPNTPYTTTLTKYSNLMSSEEMEYWEKWGFKQFYFYNPHFWWDVLKSPREWRNLLRDATGLLGFLQN